MRETITEQKQLNWLAYFMSHDCYLNSDSEIWCSNFCYEKAGIAFKLFVHTSSSPTVELVITYCFSL